MSVTSQEKNCLFLIREKKNVMFPCWKEKNNLVKKKTIPSPSGIKWSALYPQFRFYKSNTFYFH